MTTEQWKELPKQTREAMIEAVFGSTYLALTRSEQNPERDTIIKEVLKWSQRNGDTVYINIHKTIRIK